MAWRDIAQHWSDQSGETHAMAGHQWLRNAYRFAVRDIKVLVDECKRLEAEVNARRRGQP